MDITQLFKASVMTVRLQRKTELASSGRGKATAGPPVTGPSKPTGPRDDFAIEAKKVCNKITDLRNLLIENRTAYMRIGQHLKSAAHMTDAQRNLIDRESEKFVAVYTQLLAKMRSEWKSVKRKPQERQHIEAVLDLLVSYLHGVEQIYLDQKKYRVQHELETYRLLKLAADKKKIPVRPGGGQSVKIGKRLLSNGSPENKEASRAVDDALEDSDDNDWGNDGWGDWDDDKEEDVNETDSGKLESSAPQSTRHKSRTRKRNKDKQAALSDSSAKVALDEDIHKSAQELADEEDPLSADDVQLFEAENVHMYNFLQGLSEEVEQIGKNVVDIAQLQDIFTEKVAMQQHNIERIASAVVGTTENVKDANEQIRQATQRNASVRVYFLFFLIVMSFSLLFLDWYYD